MSLGRLLCSLLVMLTCGSALAADYTDLKVEAKKPGAVVTLHQMVEDGKALISVIDGAKKPLLGLTAQDFGVTQPPGRVAEILSLQPVTETINVPRHIVLVLDNSYSMRDREAIQALLAGVRALTKSVRDIDEVRIVVFSNDTTTVAGRDLRVTIFKSNKADELNEFTAKIYKEKLTASTVLYEAMLAGLEQIKEMPADEPRFMVVFSDGEDLNAAVKPEEIVTVAGGMDKFNVYSIDYMPGPELNPFLSDIATNNRGQAWKATTESTIVDIFQKVATAFDYYYIVNYRFPPKGSLGVAPGEVTIDESRAPDGAGKVDVAGGGVLHTAIDKGILVAKPTIDSAHGIVGWKVSVDNSNGSLVTVISDEPPPPEIAIDLPVDDLKALVAGGDIRIGMELKDAKQQVLALKAPPVKMKIAATGATFSVAPQTLKIDEVVTYAPGAKEGATASSALKTGIDYTTIKVKPAVESTSWIAKWKASATNGKGSLATKSGESAPPAEIKLALPSDDLDALAAGGDITVWMELTDSKGRTLMLVPQGVKVRVDQTKTTLGVAPANLTVEEIVTPDYASKDAPPTPGTAQASIDQSALVVRPGLEGATWIASWKITVENAKGKVAELSREGVPGAEVRIPLPTGDLAALAAAGDLKVVVELRDEKKKALVLNAPAVKIALNQAKAALGVTPASLNIEEIKIIDSSPMLAHIYFDSGSEAISAKYKLFAAPAETAGFDEQKFRDTLEKYYQVLNIIGKRLNAMPAAKVAIVGCNDNTAAEKGAKGLSQKRAEAVRDYLQTVWGVAADRMTIEARGLPKMPSNTTTEEGNAENRRVEIVPTVPAITAPIQSTYTNVKTDGLTLGLANAAVSPHGIESWRIALTNSNGLLGELSGQGAPDPETKLSLEAVPPLKLASGGDITAKMELVDKKGRKIETLPAVVRVNFAQSSKRMAERQDQQRVQEKYALVLFDFDKDTVGPANLEIVNSIASRIKALPTATVEIVGHTDNLGKEEYNQKLSERRATAVYKAISGALAEPAGGRVKHSGVGPNSPLYDNKTPEARSFNRTVTIQLEYVSAE